MISRPITPQMALSRLESICAHSEQCSYDAMQKLIKWGIPASCREKIIDSLIDNRYIDDYRYANAYARSKFLINHWGRKKIALGLAAKRIDRTTATEAINEATPPAKYAATLLALLRSRARQFERPIDFENRNRLIRMALSRGFEWDTISRVLPKLDIEDADHDDDEDYFEDC